jgi:hypothetical protein
MVSKPYLVLYTLSFLTLNLLVYEVGPRYLIEYSSSISQLVGVICPYILVFDVKISAIGAKGSRS